MRELVGWALALGGLAVLLWTSVWLVLVVLQVAIEWRRQDDDRP